MISAILGLVLAAAAPIQKIEVQKLDAPKMDFKLPDMPKADGLKGAEAPKNDEMQTKTAAGDLRAANTATTSVAKVVAVTHAKDFAVTKTGRKPTGAISGFTLGSLPAHIGAFKTCVHVANESGLPVSLKASFKSPGGNELLSSRADVTFGSGNEMDVVIEWDGFEATVAGDYKFVVTLDGKAAGEFPLPIQGKPATP